MVYYEYSNADQTHKTLFIELFYKIKNFTQRNLAGLGILLLFTVLAYGYFITHWAVDSDSVSATFNSLSKTWISHGRPIDALYNYLSLELVLPYFNDFISVCFIFISAILWLIIIEDCEIRLSKTLTLIFACICIICPMYSFFLRFTLQNMFTEFSMLVSVLSAYHFSSFLKNKKYFNLISSILLCSLALMSYQTYASYFITAVVFIILLRMIVNNDYTKLKIFKDLVSGALILIAALIIYKIACSIAFNISPPSDYTQQFMGWSNQTIMSVISNWQTYFYSLLTMNFNFFVLLTIAFVLPCLFIINIFKKRFLLSILLLVFAMSPFALVFALGDAMPLRTLQAVPLMLAGIWLLLYQSCANKILKRIIVAIVIVSTFFNAQHINRLFYSDVMRLEYDKNFANRIYNHVLDKTGDSVESKPLVILGIHLYKYKPFIVHYDSIGPSFFDTNTGRSARMHYFMSWLGDDYIMPTEAEVNDANVIADYMPSYPNNGYVKETKNLIVLKLSDRVLMNPPAVNLNLKKYNQLPNSKIQSSIDSLESQNKNISISGWAYIKNKNAADTKTYIRVTDNGLHKTYPVNVKQRPDIAKLQNNATNIQDSGWSIFLSNISIKKDSKVDLILVNGSDYLEKNIQLPKKSVPIKITLNLQNYKKLKYTESRSYVDTLSYTDNFLTIGGWAYLKHKNAKHTYIYKTDRTVKNNVQKLSDDTSNVKDSGFSFSDKYEVPKGNYKISLILVNGDSYVEADLNHTINMCGTLKYKCWW